MSITSRKRTVSGRRLTIGAIYGELSAPSFSAPPAAKYASTACGSGTYSSFSGTMPVKSSVPILQWI